jgi:hypothetical protein
MLVFIVPLISPQASNDWQRVSRLARRTLHSILNQTHGDFRVLLVCNEPPPNLPVHSALSLVQCDLPVPTDRESKMVDKGLKVHLGLIAARFLAPCHFMLVDADDLVSNRLAAHCAAHPMDFGWYFDRGWMHDEYSRLAFRCRKNFNLVCGTSNIVHLERTDLPIDEKKSSTEKLVFGFGHHKIRSNMEALGRPLKPLPFIGSVYIVGTGENWTSFSLRGWRSKKVFLRKLLNYRFVTGGMRRDFGLWPLSEYEHYTM